MDKPAFLEGWMPPTRDNWQTLMLVWQWGYPIGASLQWATGWYGMGKTSQPSIFNIPGRLAWLTMETPGFTTLVWTVYRLSHEPGVVGPEGLPWQNKVLAGLFVLHYAYRALAFPFLQPSMAPIHALVWCMAVAFQLLNASCLGAWLGAYGPVAEADWEGWWPTARFALGVALFYVGLAGNYFHDEELREIRRREGRRQAKVAAAAGKAGTDSVKSHYRIPEAGLFRYMLYPHYLCEWIEWAGFLLAAGWACSPARAFLVNEVASMLPRAVRGKAWYAERFGEDKIRKKWAVLPGVV